jgi:hypothetical protein
MNILIIALLKNGHLCYLKCPFSFTAYLGVKLINQNHCLKINRHYRSEKLPSLLIRDVYHHCLFEMSIYHCLSGISSSLPILMPAYLPICLFCVAAHLSITPYITLITSNSSYKIPQIYLCG